jgi:hypothetical protein
MYSGQSLQKPSSNMSGKAVQGYLAAPPKELIHMTEAPPDRAGVHDGPLRGIATALETLDVHEFELTCEGGKYVLSVKSAQANLGATIQFLKTILRYDG